MAMGKQGHAPCKISSFKNPHGSQLLWAPTSQRLGWVAPAYHKKKSPTVLERAGTAFSMTGSLSSWDVEFR